VGGASKDATVHWVHAQSSVALDPEVLVQASLDKRTIWIAKSQFIMEFGCRPAQGPSVIWGTAILAKDCAPRAQRSAPPDPLTRFSQ
jgi:hypothetical protein